MVWLKKLLTVLILAILFEKADFLTLRNLVRKAVKEFRLDKAMNEVKHKILPTGASDIIVVRNEFAICGTPIKVQFGPLPFGKYKNYWPVQIILNGKSTALELEVGRNGNLITEFSEEELKNFNLKREVNQIGFMVKIDGKEFIQTALLYYWNSNAKIVVADIDGTITKSDTIGMILEEEWLQRGVLKLFDKIMKAGYKVVYLSARPAAMGPKTRSFISKADLPFGPVILSSQPIWKALKTALNNPEEIKIENLQNLKDKFNLNNQKHPPVNPFLAGFGNQMTDLVAYKALHFPRTFLINEKGKVHIFDEKQTANWGYKLTYQEIAMKANKWFPNIKQKQIQNY